MILLPLAFNYIMSIFSVFEIGLDFHEFEMQCKHFDWPISNIS